MINTRAMLMLHAGTASIAPARPKEIDVQVIRTNKPFRPAAEQSVCHASGRAVRGRYAENIGRLFHIEYRWAAGKKDLIEQYVQDMVALHPDVILANSTPVVAALLKITGSIPSVFAGLVDPVGQGFVKSLSKPGGNITGFTFIDPELIGKWVGLLKDATPDLSRTALLFNPVTAPFYPSFLSQIETAHLPSLIALEAMPVGTPVHRTRCAKQKVLCPMSYS